MTSIANLAQRNNAEELKSLLESGVDINSFESNRTALHAACATNSINSATLLIEKGADVNLKDKYTGATALHYCAIYNCFEIAKTILEHEGRADIEDNHGNQPLWTAIFNVKGKVERLPLIELFLKHGADLNHKNKAGKSPLDFANQVKSISLTLLNKKSIG